MFMYLLNSVAILVIRAKQTIIASETPVIFTVCHVLWPRDNINNNLIFLTPTGHYHFLFNT